MSKRRWPHRSVTNPTRLTDVLRYRAPRIRRTGIKRQADRTGRASALPPTENMSRILELLCQEPISPSLIADETGIAYGTVSSSCYGLAARGLARRIDGRGWIRTEPDA